MLRGAGVALAVLLALPAVGQVQYGFKVVDRKPQSRDNFVQGLEIVGNHLYLSSGLYGQSRLRRYDFDSGELLLERPLDPRLFAEGVTVLDGKVYQLTWRSGIGLIYQQADLSPRQLFRVPGEGWGITNDGSRLIYSDGSHQLHFIDPASMTLERTLSVQENGEPLPFLNELEWVDGRIWANVWRSNRLVIINPDSGAVEASVNLQGLLPVEDYREGTDVLNGIAHDRRDGSIWVTGKRWPWLYRIERVPLDSDGPDANTATSSAPPPLLARPPPASGTAEEPGAESR
jgi:glutamine cyclotransferase